MPPLTPLPPWPCRRRSSDNSYRRVDGAFPPPPSARSECSPRGASPPAVRALARSRTGSSPSGLGNCRTLPRSRIPPWPAAPAGPGPGPSRPPGRRSGCPRCPRSPTCPPGRSWRGGGLPIAGRTRKGSGSCRPSLEASTGSGDRACR